MWSDGEALIDEIDEVAVPIKKKPVAKVKKSQKK
jgi:hypothetical protein